MPISVAVSVATPNRLVLALTAGGAETANFTVANLRALVTAGTPLDTALAATLGTTNSNAKAQAALITGGTYTNAAVVPNVTAQSFINTTCTNGLAAGVGFAPITVGACAVFLGTDPTLQISISAATVVAQEPVVTIRNVYSTER